MSRVFVIPDVHLKPWMFDRAGELFGQGIADQVVCLGDLVDDWDAGSRFELYAQTLEAALEFDRCHPDMLWCYGNHDVSYLWNALESGYLVGARELVCEYMDKLAFQAGERLRFVHRIGDTVFSHGGLMKSFVDAWFPDSDEIPVDELLEEINSFHKIELWRDSSPIWARPQGEWIDKPFRDSYWQVVGHTPVKKPEWCMGDAFLTLDTFSTYPDGVPIGDERFVVVDTESHTWEYADRISVSGS